MIQLLHGTSKTLNDLKNRVVYIVAFKVFEVPCNSSLDCEPGWLPFKLGDREFCTKRLPFTERLEKARQACADLGAKLPLPRSDAEYEAFRNKYGWWNMALDATDMDQDGIWEDSSGNVVEYLPEIWVFPGSGPRPYLMTGYGSRLTPRPESDFVYQAQYGSAHGVVICFKRVYVPPTPVTG